MSQGQVDHRQVLSTVDGRPLPVDHTKHPALCTARWRLGVAQCIAKSVAVSHDLFYKQVTSNSDTAMNGTRSTDVNHRKSPNRTYHFLFCWSTSWQGWDVKPSCWYSQLLKHFFIICLLYKLLCICNVQINTYLFKNCHASQTRWQWSHSNKLTITSHK